MLNYVALTLRARLGVALALVLSPFVLAALLGQLYLLPQLAEPCNVVANVARSQLEPLATARGALLDLVLGAEASLSSASASKRQHLPRLRERVDIAFSRLSSVASEKGNLREMVRSARSDWHQADQLLSTSHFGDHSKDAGTILTARTTSLLEDAATLLNQAQDAVSQEISAQHGRITYAQRTAIFITIIAFILALANSAVASGLLIAPIVGDTQRLARGAARLASGELSHRLAVRRHDELGTVAEAFNAMAERLEASHGKLQKLATHDELTQLSNHREFVRLLGEEFERAKRYSRPFSLLIIDLDRFKSINDRYGHLAGDRVLRAVASSLRDELRPSDRIARYGGEEFAVILPETEATGAAVVGERLRAAIGAREISLDDHEQIKVTASIGMSSFPDSARLPLDLVKVADQAMYIAKRAGRNLVRAARDQDEA